MRSALIVMTAASILCQDKAQIDLNANNEQIRLVTIFAAHKKTDSSIRHEIQSK
jgi:hypothetical protein